MKVIKATLLCLVAGAGREQGQLNCTKLGLASNIVAAQVKYLRLIRGQSFSLHTSFRLAKILLIQNHEFVNSRHE